MYSASPGSPWWTMSSPSCNCRTSRRAASFASATPSRPANSSLPRNSSPCCLTRLIPRITLRPVCRRVALDTTSTSARLPLGWRVTIATLPSVPGRGLSAAAALAICGGSACGLASVRRRSPKRRGISAAIIGAIEEGVRRRPYPNTMRALADALDPDTSDRAEPLSAQADAPASAVPALPVPLTELIGREGDVDEVSALLRTATVRLVTLVGPGGVGKTRLAIAVATAMRDEYADGVAFVDLAPLHDERLVPATIARVLGVRELGGRSAWELVLDHLRARHMLLVLDNFEHLLGAARVLTDLLGACPRVALLVTSRGALRLRAEHRHTVSPLATPSGAAPIAIAELAGSPAVRLFVDRSRSVAPWFVLDATNALAVAEICRRLDGLPLALELAAARAQLLTPTALLQRLEHRLRVLSDGPVDLPERQRTLRGTLAWNYDLLDASARALFRRLAVFAGGWTLEAAEAASRGRRAARRGGAARAWARCWIACSGDSCASRSGTTGSKTWVGSRARIAACSTSIRERWRRFSAIPIRASTP